MKRGSSGLCGVLAVDKPAGLTSHDVVDRVRRMTAERRVGHAGTLDPMATGLMLVCVGPATRLSQYLTGHDKSYEARIVFGASTDTDDAQGRVVGEPPSPLAVAETLAQRDAQRDVAGLVGRCKQLPPAYSAIKKNGVVAYKAAREGGTLELEPREVEVYSAGFVASGTVRADLDDGAGGRFQRELPYWDVVLQVSKGTYIRAIARDLGSDLGCGAHLGALRRTSVAGAHVEDACGLDALQGLCERESFPWCDPASLLGFPTVTLTDAQAADIANGRRLRGVALPGDGRVSCVHGGRLLAVCTCGEGACKPETVIPGGVAGVA